MSPRDRTLASEDWLTYLGLYYLIFHRLELEVKRNAKQAILGLNKNYILGLTEMDRNYPK